MILISGFCSMISIEVESCIKSTSEVLTSCILVKASEFSSIHMQSLLRAVRIPVHTYPQTPWPMEGYRASGLGRI